MKARIKKTGEIINIANYATVTLEKCDSYGNPIELRFDEVEILQEPTSDIDWEQRRYEIAKEVLPNQILFWEKCNELDADDDNDEPWGNSYETAAKFSVSIADTLIAELRKDNIKF